MLENSSCSHLLRVGGVVAALLSSPWWLPPAVLRARFWVFTAINGDEGRELPDGVVGGSDFKWLYNHEAAKIRSRQGRVGITGTYMWHWLALSALPLNAPRSCRSLPLLLLPLFRKCSSYQ